MTSLWQAYVNDGSEEARARLLESHLGIVYHVARQMCGTLAVQIEFEELVSYGTVGLIKSVETFDLSRGLAFTTHAAPRIRGAILDELRRQDHVPRSIRKKSRDMSSATEALMRERSGPPDDREVAETLGVDIETLWRWQREVEGAIHVSADHSPEDGNGSIGDALMGVTGDEIEDLLNHEEEVVRLREALLDLNEQERTVLTLYYFEELKLHEVADVLELTESRVSQIRSKAIMRLRTAMAPLREQAA
jgi:RNA polymerase sigma factor for flagellar operon FliA